MTKKARDVPKSLRVPISRILPAVALLVCSLIHAPANAIPIGDFVWSDHTSAECESGLCGPFFFVDNFGTEDASLGLLGDSFFNVLVNLQIGGVAQSVSLGEEIPAFGFGQSIDELFDAISSAGLSLTFGAPRLPGSVRLLDDGAVVAALTAPGSLTIDYIAPVIEPPPVSVPEPSTLLLLVGGWVGFAGLKKRRPARAIDAKDRDQVSAA